MKKIVGIAFFCIFSMILFAQRTQWGIKAGVNSASVKVSDDDDWDARTAFHVGALAHIHISEHFAVQPELVFSAQGGESGNTKLKLNYLNVPVLLQYMFDAGFRLQTGPQIGFLLSAETKTGDIEVDIDDQINSVDFAWVIGAGYLFSNGLGIDARYNIGISNIVDGPGNDAFNRVLQLGLFYQFPAK